MLDAISDLPLVPMVLWRHAERGALDRIHYLPRPRWLLRYFVIRHVDRALASLIRRYSARAALGLAPDSEHSDREAIREFQQSLPPTRSRIYFILLIVTTVVLGRPIVDQVTSYALFLIQLDTSNNLASTPELRQQVRATVEKLGAALTPDFASANEALNALLNGGLKQTTFVALGLALSLYVVLRPFVPAFRLKRMLFNLAPEHGGRRKSATARWSVSQATGIFERERRLFEGLGGRAPKEFPFDLVILALGMLAPLAWSSLIIRLGFVDSFIEDRVYDFAFGTLVLTLALLRLGWLYKIWLRRQSGRYGPYMPFEVRLRHRKTVARVESPLYIGLRAFLILFLFFFLSISSWDSLSTFLMNIATLYIVALLFSLPFSLYWWYRVNRELRDLDHSYDTQRLGRQPVRSSLATLAWFFLLLLPFISVFRTGRRIDRAQERAGQPVTPWASWILAPGLLVYPLLFAYLQRKLNTVWALEGKPLDPWPTGDPSHFEVVYKPAMTPGLVGQASELAES